ncbi:hypothetical protein PPYR_13756 [Photinus pyralis]|uniref:Carboxylic ester hydrolase n=2 Tax=Photinus pyralis TaxID=7054 RepID=A0A5N4A9Y2_PHOPY|nr:esterase FE4-like [Photinus pyralis]KAB0794136.1 hypothetical protein PPYR_13756 [Photinus pyralis]
MVKASVLILALVYCASSYHHHHNHDDEFLVSTPLGSIKGAPLQTVLGKKIYSFRGIRYAKAPINELRFQPPEQVKGWAGVYNATKDGAACPQPELSNTNEDCLFLNVYTTQLPHKGSNPNRPVLVFFHPGGYYSWGGYSEAFGPDYLLDQDIVLVTLNYRLASLGFMSTGDKFAPGNNGLKDQVVALRWVKQNIASFGGNPNLVTIFGYSAGGATTSLMLVSPMAKGLFHRAIIMSGSGFGNWPVRPHQFELAQKQARLVNCPDTDSESIFKCLKTKSAEEIGNSLYEFAEFAYGPILSWLPVIEPDCGQERFLTDDPVKLLLRGEFERVPVITTVTAEEFKYVAWNLLDNATWLREMDENFEKIAPIEFIYETDTENSKHISRELRKFYLGDGPLTEKSLPQIGKLYADGVIGFGVNRAAKLLAAKNSEPTYYYKFSYEGRYSFHYKPNTTTPEGVVHHDDLQYIFYISRFPRLKPSDPEYKTVQKMTSMLKNFAVTGVPIPKASHLLDDTEWKPIRPGNNVYLDIDEKMVMKENLYEDRYSVWERLFPLPKV